MRGSWEGMIQSCSIFLEAKLFAITAFANSNLKWML